MYEQWRNGLGLSSGYPNAEAAISSLNQQILLLEQKLRGDSPTRLEDRMWLALRGMDDETLAMLLSMALTAVGWGVDDAKERAEELVPTVRQFTEEEAA